MVSALPTGAPSIQVPIVPTTAVVAPACGRRPADQLGRRGLALGAGDADQRQRFGRLAVDDRGQLTRGAARGVVDDEDWDGDVGAQLGTLGVGQYGDRAGGDGFGSEPGAVGARAWQRRVQVPGVHARRSSATAQ